MEAMDRLRHVFVAGKLFRMFTDHRKLMHVFDPVTRNDYFRKQIADKLARWASRLYEYQFVIEHISGERNIWADMLSRWVPSETKSPNLSLSVHSLF
jgi:hypothetical protein